MPNRQPAHFFDRLPAKDGAAAGMQRAYVHRRDSDGRYFLADTTIVAGATRVYFQDRDDYTGRVQLDTDGAGARIATLYGANVVVL